MKIISYIFALLLLFPAYSISATKPPPPPELTEILLYFNYLEEDFENAKWDDALEHFEMANKVIGKLLSNLRKNTDRKALRSFEAKFLELRDKIKSRHPEFSKDSFIDMTMAYFILTDYYDIEPPLFLTTVGNYIDEAEEAFEKNKFDEVVFEMREIGEFIESFYRTLLSHGAKEESIENFLINAMRVRRAAEDEKKNTAKIRKGLNNLRKIHGEFMGNHHK